MLVMHLPVEDVVIFITCSSLVRSNSRFLEPEALMPQGTDPEKTKSYLS